MITIEKLKIFKEQLELISQDVNELISLRSPEQLFTNSDDYYHQLKACEYCPQDYYKARFFDTVISLNYSRRYKQFYLYIESVNTDVLTFKSLQDFITSYDLKRKGKTNILKDSYFIDNKLSFKDVTNIYYHLCDILCLYYMQDKKDLFIYR